MSRAPVGGEATGRVSLPPSRFACPHFSSWRAQRLLRLPRKTALPLWLKPRTYQLKIQPRLLSHVAPASASCTLGPAVAMASDLPVWPASHVSSSPR